MTLYLKNANYLDAQTLELRKTHLAVEPGPTGGVAFRDAIPSDSELSTQDKVVDCRDRLVTRSFACGHHHIYSTLARGMPAPPRTPVNFLEVLEYIWWRVDKRLDRDMIAAGALARQIAQDSAQFRTCQCVEKAGCRPENKHACHHQQRQRYTQRTRKTNSRNKH